MIDPTKITNFNSTDNQLEEVLLFWVLVAGKTARSIARSLDEMLNKLPGDTPFEKIRQVGEQMLPSYLKLYGVGCYRVKAKALWDLVNKGLNLRTCSVEELESVYGIGPKTARCFLIHSRPNQQYAALDTHILKYLRENSLRYIPKSTPSSGRFYRSLEKEFLAAAARLGKSVAEFDLEIWNKYARKETIIHE